MPSIGRDDVARLGDLARIQLTDEEVDRLAGEFDANIDAVASVSEVATAAVPATSHPIPMTNVFRERVVGQTQTPAQALSGAPVAEGGRVGVRPLRPRADPEGGTRMAAAFRRSAAARAAAPAAGETTSEDLTRAHLDRIRAVDTDLHAFLHVSEEEALTTARDVDARRSA